MSSATPGHVDVHCVRKNVEVKQASKQRSSMFSALVCPCFQVPASVFLDDGLLAVR